MSQESIDAWKGKGWKSTLLELFIFSIAFTIPFFIVFPDFSVLNVNIPGSSISKLILVYILSIFVYKIHMKESFEYKKNKLKAFVTFLILPYKILSFISIGIKRNRFLYFIGIFLIILFSLYALLNQIILWQFKYYGGQPIYENIFKLMLEVPFLMVQSIVFVSVLEEFIFRGYVFNIIRAFFSDLIGIGRFKNIFINIASVFIISFIFAIAHYSSFAPPTGGLRFLNIFFGSVVITSGYLQSNGLALPIFLHTGYNVYVDFFDRLVTKTIGDSLITILNNCGCNCPPNMFGWLGNMGIIVENKG